MNNNKLLNETLKAIESIIQRLKPREARIDDFLIIHHGIFSGFISKMIESYLQSLEVINNKVSYTASFGEKRNF